jgi:hypothetical protein
MGDEIPLGVLGRKGAPCRAVRQVAPRQGCVGKIPGSCYFETVTVPANSFRVLKPPWEELQV